MFQLVYCAKCGKSFKRPVGRYNEAVKFEWKQYCSKRCKVAGKRTAIVTVCNRPDCNKKLRDYYDRP